LKPLAIAMSAAVLTHPRSFKMRVSVLAVLASLAASATADSMRVDTWCTLTQCNSGTARWDSAYGSYWLDANEGCRDPPNVPGMNSICMDWGNKRAHFFFDNQPKRCLRMTEDYEWNAFADCNRGLGPSCRRSIWSEVACNW